MVNLDWMLLADVIKYISTLWPQLLISLEEHGLLLLLLFIIIIIINYKYQNIRRTLQTFMFQIRSTYVRMQVQTFKSCSNFFIINRFVEK